MQNPHWSVRGFQHGGATLGTEVGDPWATAMPLPPQGMVGEPRATTVRFPHPARWNAALASVRLVVSIIERRTLLVVRGASGPAPGIVSPGAFPGRKGRGLDVALPTHQPLVALVRECLGTPLLQQWRGLQDRPRDVVVGGRLLGVIDGQLLERLLRGLPPGRAVLELSTLLTEATHPVAPLPFVSVPSWLYGGLEPSIKVGLLDSDVAESLPQGLGLLVDKVLLVLILAEKAELEAQLRVLGITLQGGLAVLAPAAFPRQPIAEALPVLWVLLATLVRIWRAVPRRHHHLDALDWKLLLHRDLILFVRALLLPRQLRLLVGRRANDSGERGHLWCAPLLAGPGLIWPALRIR